MKKFINNNKIVLTVLGAIAVVVLFITGDSTTGVTLASIAGASVSLSDSEKQGFSEQEQKVILAVKKLTAQLQDQVSKGYIGKDELDAAVSGIKTELSGGEIKNLQEELKRLEGIAKEQGTSLTEISNKMQYGGKNALSVAKQLEIDKDELKTIYGNRNGTKTYMLTANAKGEFVMRPFDVIDGKFKAAGPHATVAAVGGGGNTASVTQDLDAATILRLGSESSPIVSQFRNSPWVFGMCNLINTGYEQPFAVWYDEQAKQGASANVAEGATKPTVQYEYLRKSDTYKKEAMLVSFTDEFSLDFPRLQDDILNKAKIDLVNRMNSAILPRIISAATAYNTGVSFKGDVGIENVNDFDAIAAMAAQVENSTFSTIANTAVMSTFKKHRLGIQKDTHGGYLNPPASLNNISFVGNPDMGDNNVLVGDFKNYNIMLRGGIIVRVGYIGNDFANNMFSVVIEQFYFDYISDVRKAAIVKGTDFATVKTAITGEV